MRKIKLTQGQVAIVDDEWFDYLNQWQWHATKHNGQFYAERSAQVAERRTGQPKHIYMHAVINNTPTGLGTDHVNGNKLDNRRANLRDASDAQNFKNVSKHRDNPRAYKGVYPNHKRWMARIKANGQMIYIGTYDTPEEAARAYNSAAIQHHGAFANLNSLD